MLRLNPLKEKSPRENLLDEVKREVKAGRSQSLHKAVLLNLPGENPSQFRRLWDIDLKIGSRPSFQVPQNAGIAQLFDRMGGKLLILGAVGAGKTTTLLELAGKLANRAENDATLPCPVLLNLAARQDDSVAIADWLVEQIQVKYNIPVNISQQWLSQQQLLPLFDGLDEIETERYDGFIQAINQFIEGEFTPKSLAVCSSFEAYKKCKSRFKLRAAILLKPLTENQIREYLIGARSREIWYSIEDHPELLKLAKTPLLLNMLTLAYEEILIESWKRLPSAEAQRQYLLSAYIRRQMTRKTNQKCYAKGKEPQPEKFRYWLVWLAKKMKEENITNFSLKNLSPSWLQTAQQQQIYFMGIILITGLIVSLTAGITGAIFGVTFGLTWGIIFGIIAGGISSLIIKMPGIENFIVRLVLWYYGYIPWNYERFLNYASERLLLQKLRDNRYQFIHNLLQEHFAKM